MTQGGRSQLAVLAYPVRMGTNSQDLAEIFPASPPSSLVLALVAPFGKSGNLTVTSPEIRDLRPALSTGYRQDGEQHP